MVFREFYETNKKVHFAVFYMILLQLQNADYLYTFSQNMSVVLDSVFWGISLLNELKLKILVPEYPYDLIHSRFHIEGSLYIQHLVTSGGTLNFEETF